MIEIRTKESDSSNYSKFISTDPSIFIHSKPDINHLRDKPEFKNDKMHIKTLSQDTLQSKFCISDSQKLINNEKNENTILSQNIQQNNQFLKKLLRVSGTTKRQKNIKLASQLTRFNGKNKKIYGRQLKQIVKKQKINNIVNSFVQKLKRNNTYKTKQQYSYKKFESNKQWWNFKGIQLSQSILNCYQLIRLMFQFIQIYLFSLIIVFSLQNSDWIYYLEVASLLICIVQIILSSITVTIYSGKKLIYVKQIFYYYFKQEFILDILAFFILLLILYNKNSQFNYLLAIFLFKMPLFFQKLEKLQIRLIQSTYKQQYWSIFKVFLFNFCFAHFLALVLYGMSRINPQQSWLEQKQLIKKNASWLQIYTWAYYWAVNMMLTVGLGDIVASNSDQALILTFVQTLSCIVLAYNINFVGTLINAIRQQDLQKYKKYKIFRSLSIKHNISSQLFLKVSNYIEQSNNIKKKFNIEEQNKFIQNLPKVFKKDYLSESNKSIFDKIFFFCNLADKAVQSLAQSIQITIAHPSQLIFNHEDYRNLKILKQGSIGYCIKKSNCIYNGKIIDKVSVQEGQSPFLIGLNFIINNKPNYQVKSLQYSINYSLTYNNLIQCLKKSKGDYEYYCFLRDKSKHIIDQFQVLKCQTCKTNHTKFNCPLYHFIPIHQHVINKYLKKYKQDKNKRNKSLRIEMDKYYPLLMVVEMNIKNKPKLNPNTIKKNKDFIIKQLFKVQKFQTQRSVSYRPQQNLFQILNKHYANESLKQQLSHVINQKMDQDKVWQVASDLMQNFKCYFPFDNPCNIVEKFKYSDEWHRIQTTKLDKQVKTIAISSNNEVSMQQILHQYHIIGIQQMLINNNVNMDKNMLNF